MCHNLSMRHLSMRHQHEGQEIRDHGFVPRLHGSRRQVMTVAAQVQLTTREARYASSLRWPADRAEVLRSKTTQCPLSCVVLPAALASMPKADDDSVDLSTCRKLRWSKPLSIYKLSLAARPLKNCELKTTISVSIAGNHA
jgi:hypothetical protein